MKFKVVFEFHKTQSKAKSALRKIPKIFSNPHLFQLKDGTYAVLAGEYDRKDWADAAIHKLYEHHLYGGYLTDDLI